MTDPLGRLTSAQLRGRAPTVLVPLGSTEQHGPHLPLDTDTRIASAVADLAASRSDVLVAPAIPYGSSGEHQDFPGTVSVGAAALTALLVEFGRSACRWASRLVFVNGHGGNAGALCSAVPALREEGRDVAWFGCADPGADPHAGHTETSVLLHLCPDLVRSAERRAGNTEPLADLMPRMRRGGVAAVSDTGVLGDPTTATAADGALILDRMASDCVARLRRWTPDGTGRLR